MRRSILKPIVFSVLSGYFVAGCNSGTRQPVSSCRVTPTDADFNILIDHQSLRAGFWIADDDRHYQFGHTNIEAGVFDHLVSYLHIPLQKNVLPVSLVLYSDKCYSPTDTLFRGASLQGYSMYYYRENILYHMLFLKGGDGYFRPSVPRLNCAAIPDFGYIHRMVKLLFRNRFDDVSAIVINVAARMKEPGEDKADILNDRLASME